MPRNCIPNLAGLGFSCHLLVIHRSSIMSRRTAVLPLLILLLGGCGAAPDPAANSGASPDASPEVRTETSPGVNQEQASVQTDSPPATVSQPVPSPTVVPSDTTIVPGERLGPVTLTTTYAELAKEFGSDRLSDTQVHLGEGFMAPATRVDLGDDYSFSVVWTDGDRSSPLEVREVGPGWQTPEGVHHGMSFSQLEAVLGDFELLGFGWDYGGTVLLDNTVIADYSGKMFIRVGPSASEWEAKGEQLIKVSGDQAFSSSDPNFDGVDIEVYELVVRLNAF